MNNEIDYIDLLKKSALFAWEYKSLWLFGFLFSFFSGGISFNYTQNIGSSDIGTEIVGDVTRGIDTVGDTMSLATITLTVVGVAVVALIWTVVSWYFSNISRISLVRASKANVEDSEQKIGFKSMWRKSQTYLLPVLKYALFWLAISVPVFLIFGLLILSVIFLGVAGWILLVCGSIPLIIIFTTIVSLLKAFSYRYLVLEEQGVVDSLKSAWEFIKSNLGTVIIGWLVMLIPMIPVGLVTVLISGMLLVPVFIAIIPLIVVGQNIIAIIVLIIAGILMKFLISFINAPVVVLSEYFWIRLMDSAGGFKR